VVSSNHRSSAPYRTVLQNTGIHRTFMKTGYYIDWLLDMVIVYPDGTVDILLYNDDLPVYERIEISSLPYFLPGDLTYIGPL